MITNATRLSAKRQRHRENQNARGLADDSSVLPEPASSHAPTHAFATYDHHRKGGEMQHNGMSNASALSPLDHKSTLDSTTIELQGNYKRKDWQLAAPTIMPCRVFVPPAEALVKNFTYRSEMIDGFRVINSLSSKDKSLGKLKAEHIRKLKPEPGPKLDTFTLFPNLPCELRLKIWEACLRITRREPHIYIQPCMAPVTDEHGNKYMVRSCVYTSRSYPKPALFYASREAYAIARRDYSQAFGTQIHAPRLCVNYARDRPFFRTRSPSEFIIFVDNLSETDLCRIEQFSVRLRDWANIFTTAFFDSLRKFTNLNQVMLFVSDLSDEVGFNSDVRQTCLNVRAELRVHSLRYPEWNAPRIRVKVVKGLGDLYDY